MKYTIQQLALRMSERTGVPAEKCEAFVRHLFSDAEARLMADGKAEIEGFATFSKAERANGQTELMFVPSETVADNVNSAFSMFEPEVLNPDVTTEMLDSVSVPVVEPAEVATPDEVESHEAAVIPEPVPEAKDEAIPQEVVQPGEPEPTATVNGSPKDAGNATEPVIEKTEPIIEKTEPVEEKPEPIAEKPEPVAAEPAQVEVKPVTVEAKQESAPVKQEPVEEKPEPIPAPVVPKVKTLVEETEETTAVDESSDNEADGRPSSLLLFFIGLIVGLAVGATLAFLYMSSVMTTVPAVE